MNQSCKYLALISVISGFWIYRRLKKQCRKHKLDTKVVVITGCDSGLGYSMALYCHNLGMVVCATVLNPSGKTAKELQELGETTGRLVVIHLDVTDTANVRTAVKQVAELFEEDKSLELCAIVNNAGIMVFGESEWQTENLILKQIYTNLYGPIQITKYFSPLLRHHRGRIINISSHCALAGLPGLSVYAGTKAGLLAWSDALRIEMSKFGVKVISFVPGSFVTQTSILSNQSQYADEMAQSMDKDVFEFYKDYFHQCNSYLSFVSKETTVRQITDNTLYTNLNDALLSYSPKTHYMNSPLRYSFYHFLFSVSPVWLRDKLVQKFVSLPKWNQ